MTYSLPRVGTYAAIALAMLAFGQLTSTVLSTAQQADLPWLWWASRSSGLVAYLAMALSMLFGVLITSRGLDAVMARKTVLELHQQWTLAAVVSTVVHVLTVVLHAEAKVGLVGALVPFASTTLTGPLALGIVGMWGLLILAASSWLRTYISYTLWRGIHGTAFGAFLLAGLHSVFAGTDSGVPLVQWMYLVTFAVVAGSVLYRVLISIGGERAASKRAE
ncbi:MAG: hypothetical protein WC211_01070 [Dehalococcoidia bacterium]|jgi:predicted ferric reductase